MKKIFLFALLPLFASQAALATQIFKWVDEDGQTHFSSQPPAHLDAQRVNIKASAGSTAQAEATPEEASESKPADTEEQQEAEATPQLSATEKAQRCLQARQSKEALGTNHSRRFKQDDGSVRPFSAQERQEMEANIEEAIRFYCN